LDCTFFCRKSLFENCYELTPTFAKFIQKPTKLQLVQNENYPTQRRVGDSIAAPFQIEDVVHIGKLVSNMQLELLQASKVSQSEEDELKVDENDEGDE